MYMDNVCLNLKKAREQAGMTQKEVEKTLGLRGLQMRDYEVGRLKIPIKIAIQLADLYNMSIDELVGHKVSHEVDWQQFKALSSFNSIFTGHSFSIMFLDPILRAFLEERKDLLFEQSFFDILTEHLSKKEKLHFVQELSQILFFLACSDGRIDNTELECIKSLLSEYSLSSKIGSIKKELAKNWFQKEKSIYFKKIEIKHFITWLLFIFAISDGVVTFEEHEFIEKVAEKLKVNKSNFLQIQSHFKREE